MIVGNLIKVDNRGGSNHVINYEERSRISQFIKNKVNDNCFKDPRNGNILLPRIFNIKSDLYKGYLDVKKHDPIMS